MLSMKTEASEIPLCRNAWCQKGQCSGYVKVNHPLVLFMQFQQHLFAAPLKTHINGSSLGGWSFLRSVRLSGSLPSPEYCFVLVSRKCPYQEQTQHFVCLKFPVIPVKDLAAQVRQCQSPGSASQITKAVRGTTILMKLVLKTKARGGERKWKLSRTGSLSIANLLLIRAALMHNTQESGKNSKSPGLALFLGELKQILGSGIWKTILYW